MAVRTIIRMGHPALRIPARDYPADSIGSPEFTELITDMRETLHAYGGIGLAAPQIDVGYRIAIVEIENTTTRYGEVEATVRSVSGEHVVLKFQEALIGDVPG